MRDSILCVVIDTLDVESKGWESGSRNIIDYQIERRGIVPC